MNMAFKAALKLAKEVGYDGPETLAALKAWNKEHAAIVDRQGKTVEIVITATEGEQVQVTDGSEQQQPAAAPAAPPPAQGQADGASAVERVKSLEAELERAREKAAIANARGSDTRVFEVDSGKVAGFSPASYQINRARKAYDNRVKNGQVHPQTRKPCVFTCADEAELFGAMVRLDIHSWYANEDYRVRNYAMKKHDMEIVQKVGSSFQNLLGGNWITGQFSDALIDIKYEYGAARQVCGVTPMSERTLSIFRNGDDATVVWEAESATIDADDPDTELVTLVAQKLAGICRQPMELLNDSAVNIADVVARSFAREAAKKEDSAFFIGDGTSTYGGFQGWTKKLANISTNPEDGAGVFLETGAAISETTLANWHQLLGGLPEFADTNNVYWVVHKSVWGNNMASLANAAGGVTRAEIEGKPRPMFLGYPVVFSPIMPVYSTSDTTDVIFALFGDFSMGSKFGEVSGEQGISTSEHRYWDQDQIGIKYRERVAINVHDVGDTSTAGPVVGLITEDA